MLLSDPRYERFAVALVTAPSQAAALRASHKPARNWPAKRVHSTASEWAKRPDVRGRVAELQRQISEQTVLERAEVLRELRLIALSDIRGIFSAEGKLLLPHELSATTAAAIQSFKMTIDGTIEYKFHPKVQALEQCAKVLGLYEKDNEQKADPLKALLQALKPQTAGVTADNSPSDQVEDEED